MFCFAGASNLCHFLVALLLSPGCLFSYLYDVKLQWNLRATFTKSLGAITHLDFDTNSEFIQNTDATGDVYVC